MKGKKKFKAAALMLSLIMAFGLTGGLTYAADDTEVSTYTTSSYEEGASLNLELANSISIGSEVNADGRGGRDRCVQQ